ncbi:hypothetical protein FUA48_01355 [Flavobacterium alkalisoli]|uniref:Uncharacterized protein n=1 Tax=Flavobacterium alkalisoli TaxID=2602769 RepID=A0A5B9FPL4_9FLAO|nr:hypothetical protein [Flavobacterium alkalisoli]QEE48269.1 hypothetical protein FUA48_01355 [Flavobacterium alkalisoli]
MPIDRHTGEFIDLSEAKILAHDFQNDFPSSHKCYYLGAEKLQELLAQEGCMGIRIYRALDKTRGEETLVLVGVNAECKDMTDGKILDRMVPCPSICDINSPLSL